MILKTHPNAEVSLHRTGGGVFEITVDSRLVWSKKATGRFPTDQDVTNSVS